ncbi:MAG: hypothetical protein IIC69_02005 [Nanoarchaeota archaeon]|nr:hypothetical protein [Nanoarchaeota archaeon]
MLLLKKLILFTIIFSLYLSIVNAASFDATAVPINDRIVIDEFAAFQLNIKNNLDRYDEYRIYTLDFPTWDIRTEPIANPITLELEPGAEGSVELVVDPLKIRDIGAYQVGVNVRSKLTDDVITVPLKVTIMSTEPLIQGYAPTVVTGVEIPEKIDPRQEVPIKISLNNQNIIDYPDLIITLESNLIKDTINIQLGPKGEKTLELKVNLDPLTKPQEDRLVVTVFKGDRRIINPIVRKIEIIEYEDKQLVKEEKKFSLTRSYYDFVSNNDEYEGKFKVETSLFASIFSSTNPKAKVISENGKRYFVWDVELENNRMQVVVTKNFIPLFAAILLLIAAVISYYVLRSPLLMVKEASNIVKKEGGTSEMTVILHIKNRSKNKIKEIEISDHIPALVAVGHDISIGSLQPTKMLKHESKGTTIAKWEIDALDASEERVLSYRIKSKLPILGSFSLPAANAVFKSNGKTMTSDSNRLSISD